MTKTEINKFRTILEARVIELDRSTGRREMISIEETADSLDGRLRAAEREFAARSLEAGAAKLRETRDALDRIADGTYGICVECQGVISSARLAAVPWAALCIHCQETADCGRSAHNTRSTFAMAA